MLELLIAWDHIEDRSADELGAGDDNAVSKSFSSVTKLSPSGLVHPSGAAIIHSRSRIELPAAVLSPSPLRGDADCLLYSPFTVGVGSQVSLMSDASGVGNHDFTIVSMLGLLGCPDLPAEPSWFAPYVDALRVGSHEPDTVSLMGCAEIGCAETAPLRIEPEFGKVGQHSSQSKRAQPRHVLGDDNRGPRFADDAREVRPESSLVAGSSSSTGDGVGLTGEAADDDGNASWRERSDILEPFRVRPVPREHSSAPWIDFYLPRWRSEASALQAEIQEADP